MNVHPDLIGAGLISAGIVIGSIMIMEVLYRMYDNWPWKW